MNPGNTFPFFIPLQAPQEATVLGLYSYGHEGGGAQDCQQRGSLRAGCGEIRDGGTDVGRGAWRFTVRAPLLHLLLHSVIVSAGGGGHTL